MNIATALELAPALLLLAGILATGCGGDVATAAPTTDGTATAAAKPGTPPAKAPSVGRIASCDRIESASQCTEFGEDNIEVAGEDYLKKFCGPGTFKMVACPKEKALGRCSNKEGTRIFYSQGANAYDLPGAEKFCKAGFPPSDWKAGG